MALTDKYMGAHCATLVDQFKGRFKEVWNYPRFSAPFQYGTR